MDDLTALRELARRQDNVLTRSQALDFGMHRSSVAHRIRPGGPWRRILPGVYATAGPPSADQRLTAALLYVGPGGVLTGTTALMLHGVGIGVGIGVTAGPADSRVHVVVPNAVRRANVGFLVVHRTLRPVRLLRLGGRPVCTLERAVVDACGEGTDRAAVLALVGAVVRESRSSLGALRAAAELLPRDGAALRSVLTELASADDPPGAELGALVRLAGLPEPWWNVWLETEGDEPLAAVAAWWPEAALAFRLDRPGAADDAAAGRLTAAGVVVLRAPVDRLKVRSAGLADELRAAHAAGALRAPRPTVRVRGDGGEMPS